MSADSQSPIITDRTTMTTDWKCGRKRWWYRDYGKQGIVSAKESPHLREGRYIHEDLAKVAMGMSLDVILEEMGPPPLDDSILLEPWLRRRGWIVAFYRYLWPRLVDKYDVVATEHELVLDRGGLWVAGTPDLIVRDKADGKLEVWDYKSVGMVGRSWVTHWPYAVQMMLNAKAIEEEMGEAPKYSRVIGLVKGQEQEGKLRHPYTWAWVDIDKDPPQWLEKWKYGAMLAMTSDYPGGVESWVERLGEEVGLAQFPMSAPIFQNERLMEKLINQVTRREQEVQANRAAAQTDERVRDKYWPFNFEECRPSFGEACPYLAACHNGTVNEDPIGSGLYVERTPHHDVRVDELEASDEV